MSATKALAVTAIRQREPSLSCHHRFFRRHATCAGAGTMSSKPT
jgi:hypothetical protein